MDAEFPNATHLTAEQSSALDWLLKTYTGRRPASPMAGPVGDALIRGTTRPGLAPAIVSKLPDLLRLGDSVRYEALVGLLCACPEALPLDQWLEFLKVVQLLQLGRKGVAIGIYPRREPPADWYRGALYCLRGIASRLETYPGCADHHLPLLRGD